MPAIDELTATFVELVKNVLNTEVQKAVSNGKVEVHIGFSEVSVYDDSSYAESLIRPFVHIKQVDHDDRS